MEAIEEGTEVRELDHRGADGLEISLLWDPLTDSVLVAVVDAAAGVEFEFHIDAPDALDAFRHPYAYAPGVEHTTRAPIGLDPVAGAGREGEAR